MFSSLRSFLALAGAASILAALCEAPSSWASRSSPFLAAPLHGHGLQGCGEQMDRGLRKQISREMTEKAEDAGCTFLPGFFFFLLQVLLTIGTLSPSFQLSFSFGI